jgi:hypothetical protein
MHDQWLNRAESRKLDELHKRNKAELEHLNRLLKKGAESKGE